MSTVHSILRNRLYTGWFEWNGKLYQGKHEPLVSVELWERVQGVMDGRNAKQAPPHEARLRLLGADRLRQCGCSVVGEIKKQHYVYYHCTGYADKCRATRLLPPQYVREEVLEQQFTELLGRLRFDDEVLDWVREALHASHADERREHEEAIERLQAEHERLGDRINAMYIDKLDGKIGGDFFDKMAGEWREEQPRLQREIDRHEDAEQSYMDEGVQILELARNAQACSSGRHRARNAACSISCFRTARGRMARWSPPSANHLICLAETTAIAARQRRRGRRNSAKNEIWLGDLDSNQG